ncbi:light-harvesting chlorophyll-a/b protein of photosystem I [Scenedesmus sp. NREL 46B-D3]|nr:light-harvesting chlorophyll-a/b protein of photosystem I [Scenedesmus sp. NREL 46B-D3]
MLAQKSVMRPAVASRARSVSVKAAADNVASARQWISNWKNKQAASANRPSWFPGSKFPDHLDGTLVGDHGFDPLSLGKDPAKLKWYQQAELQNGRWAMLGAAGILVPDLLRSIGMGGPAAQVPWFEAGKYEYFAPPSALFASMMFLFAFVEFRRLQDIRKPGSANQDPIFTNNKLPDGEVGYPGGIFDPLGYSKGNMETLKLKEIKNARLAMLGFAGFVAQWYTTGKTPLQNLSDHLANPWSTTVLSNDLARL